MNEQVTSITKGGRRKGSGRPKLGKVIRTVRLTPETDAFLKVQAAVYQSSVSEVIERLVNKRRK